MPHIEYYYTLKDRIFGHVTMTTKPGAPYFLVKKDDELENCVVEFPKLYKEAMEWPSILFLVK